ncbi:hypothetical protein NA57DRAFT_44451 [Rhizodiscina lignyota]|uniref:Leucine rich repeat domain-containing protein n=1 Tax=Rhizodiscina lignyota TaxID=1504668 RepID=A0A9P4IC10_9PEZI|nr:hypothetical protein NA57DRAFT_44451 [Rhizodiscina lignyota]
MDSEDGHLFIKNLAQFVRTHEKALANALQLQRQSPRRGHGQVPSGSATPTSPTFNPPSSTASSIAAALSLPYLNFTSPNNIKPVKLTLTPHHLFYLLSRFEELNVPVGPMNVRLENIHTDASPAEYVSFLSQAQRNKVRSSDRDSMHSVSSLRSVMSGMTSFWSSFGLSKSTAKTEKQKAALKEDLKYLYSAFTKIPCLRLAPDHKARLIAGWEEFPFDTAVPLFAFKNLSALEISDVDFRQFYGWDRMADQLRSLTVKRSSLDDPADLLINIVLDDMDKRRRKAAKAPGSPTTPLPTASPRPKHADLARYSPEAESPPIANRRVSSDAGKRSEDTLVRDGSPDRRPSTRRRPRSASPTRPSSSRHSTSHHHHHHHHHNRASMSQLRRTSGSSGSSLHSNTPRGSSSNLLSMGFLPPSKWRFLRHLSIADNSLTTLSVASLSPLANTLQSLDISSNLFTEVPDSLASLTALRALNLSNCMIESLHSLLRNPLPAVATLNLRRNRLISLAGVERLLSLERVDFRDNRLTDPTELARLTGIPEIREVYVNRNPFTKTHSTYRITIFNLFRSTSGYTEDIILDASPPSYSERKQLVDRAPELVNIPIIKPPLEEEEQPRLSMLSTIPSAVSTHSMVADSVKEETSSQPARTEYAVASHKRRKAARRRMVELSKQDDSVSKTFGEMSLASDGLLLSPPLGENLVATQTPFDPEPPTSQPQQQEAQDYQTQPSLKAYILPPLPTLDTNVSETVHLPKRAISELPVNGGETYRKKIEALRNDLGPQWLSAFTDERWDTPPVGGLSHPASVTSMVPPAIPVRTQSQSMVSTGRTLG